ncbi:transposable element Tc1 transposase [Trichonephila clavipes]|uniref:Transposable element Tc1 transposase n=1 Tax=Trichonephila clavipes TaxID=2585209 RepID=A0A8X6VAE8_TRICX|nr:transposable element Tc1 transposase [Trichonephila clavipes]
MNDRTASSKQLVARWSTATGVLMSASSNRRHLLHRALRARVPLYRIPLTANHRRLRLQWAHEHRAWKADWYQVVFSDESRFNLWDHDGRIRVRRYTGERCLLECVIEQHSALTPRVMVWGAISYHGRSNLLRIEGNLNNNVREVLQPEESFSSLKAILELSFIRIMHAHMFETSVQPNTCNFFFGLLNVAY